MKTHNPVRFVELTRRGLVTLPALLATPQLAAAPNQTGATVRDKLWLWSHVGGS